MFGVFDDGFFDDVGWRDGFPPTDEGFDDELGGEQRNSREAFDDEVVRLVMQVAGAAREIGPRGKRWAFAIGTSLDEDVLWDDVAEKEVLPVVLL